jgi:UDP-3-O-[3-hydroxymyristoyl] N-acetylglucosamine deacetylase
MTARKTLARPITTSGIALHAGVTVTMTLSPGSPESGVVFRRTDLGGKEVPALYDRVGETRLGTVIEKDGASVGVIEHLMAAVAGAGIDDLLVTLDGPEPPILDGDALSYLALIEQAGLKDQPVARQAIRVLKPIRVEQKDASASLMPAEASDYEFEIEFPTPAIGRQTFAFTLTPANFRADIAPARTFGFVAELEGLHKMNLARGASLENTLALSDNGVVNRALMRFPDEFVRHKILDAVGDMALAGAPLLGRFRGVKSGHGLNNRLLRALFSVPSNYQKVTLP